MGLKIRTIDCLDKKQYETENDGNCCVRSTVAIVVDFLTFIAVVYTVPRTSTGTRTHIDRVSLKMSVAGF